MAYDRKVRGALYPLSVPAMASPTSNIYDDFLINLLFFDGLPDGHLGGLPTDGGLPDLGHFWWPRPLAESVGNVLRRCDGA